MLSFLRAHFSNGPSPEKRCLEDLAKLDLQEPSTSYTESVLAAGQSRVEAYLQEGRAGDAPVASLTALFDQARQPATGGGTLLGYLRACCHAASKHAAAPPMVTGAWNAWTLDGEKTVSSLEERAKLSLERGDVRDASALFERAAIHAEELYGREDERAWRPYLDALKSYFASDKLLCAADLLASKPAIGRFIPADALEIWNGLCLIAERLPKPAQDACLCTSLSQALTRASMQLAPPRSHNGLLQRVESALADLQNATVSTTGAVISEAERWKARVLSKSGLTPAVRAKALDKAARLGGQEDGERDRCQKWLEVMMGIPFGHYSEDLLRISESDGIHGRLRQVRRELDAKIIGHADAKEKVINFLCRRARNPDSRATVLGICGPGGTGKSRFARVALGAALGRPVVSIPLAGREHASQLGGLGRGFLGFHEGAIAKGIADAGCMDPVLFFDEVDKVTRSAHGQAIIDKLLLITDRDYQKNFEDDFLEGVKFDLSRCPIVLCYNDPEPLGKLLRRRIDEVTTKALSSEEKLLIGKRLQLPEALQEAGLAPEDLYLEDAVWDALLVKIQDIDGAGELEVAVTDLVSKVNTSLLSRGVKPPVSLGITSDGAYRLFDTGSSRRREIFSDAVSRCGTPADLLCTLKHFKDVLPTVSQFCFPAIGLDDANIAQVADLLLATGVAPLSLSLPGNAITSRGFESLCRFTSLTHINLTRNRIERLPEDFTKLRALKQVCLAGNRLTQFPSQLQNVASALVVRLDASLQPSQMPHDHDKVTFLWHNEQNPRPHRPGA